MNKPRSINIKKNNETEWYSGAHRKKTQRAEIMSSSDGMFMLVFFRLILCYEETLNEMWMLKRP